MVTSSAGGPSPYDLPHFDAAAVLGDVVSPQDPDRAVIEPWASGIDGRILDVGSGTGRWTGHLVALGHDVAGLEPSTTLIDVARRAHPGVEFRHGVLADLSDSDSRWAGLLAWYSLIHMGPDELPDALKVLRHVIEDDGSLLMSFFSGPRLEPMPHPATTAHRWPLPDVRQVLRAAGFEVVVEHWEPPLPHAHVVARAVAGAERE